MKVQDYIRSDIVRKRVKLHVIQREKGSTLCMYCAENEDGKTIGYILVQNLE